MDPDIAARTLAEMEQLHERVARLEGLWDKIKDAASAAKKAAVSAVTAKKTPDSVAHDILNYAAKNNVGTERKLDGAQVSMKIRDEEVTVTAQADGTVVVAKGQDKPSVCKSAADAEKLLSQWQALLAAAAADVMAYSAAIRMQQQQQANPYPRMPLY
jgi:hypothetical protein